MKSDNKSLKKNKPQYYCDMNELITGSLNYKFEMSGSLLRDIAE